METLVKPGDAVSFYLKDPKWPNMPPQILLALVHRVSKNFIGVSEPDSQNGLALIMTMPKSAESGRYFYEYRSKDGTMQTFTVTKLLSPTGSPILSLAFIREEGEPQLERTERPE